MEMDHHCIFLNSCVGLNNMRHFLLLLLYLTVGCTYTLAACSSVLWQERVAVMSNWSRQASILVHQYLHLTVVSTVCSAACKRGTWC